MCALAHNSHEQRVLIPAELSLRGFKSDPIASQDPIVGAEIDKVFGAPVTSYAYSQSHQLHFDDTDYVS